MTTTRRWPWLNPADGVRCASRAIRYFSFTEESGFVSGMQTMNPDGSGRAFIDATPTEGHQPDWGTAPLVP